MIAHRRCAALASAALIAVVAGPQPARAQDVADGVVAVIGDRPLMLSAVLFEVEVRTVLDSGGRLVNLGPPAPDCDVLEALVVRTLLLQEAEGEQLAVDEEVNRRLEVFIDAFERVEDLTRWLGRWSIGTAELRTHFTAELRADTFAQLRAEAITRVSEREVVEAWQDGGERWDGVPLEQAAPVLEQELWQARMDGQQRSLVDAIREQRGVRYTDLGRSLFECEQTAVEVR
jgi:hypothetical protein